MFIVAPTAIAPFLVLLYDHFGADHVLRDIVRQLRRAGGATGPQLFLSLNWSLLANSRPSQPIRWSGYPPLTPAAELPNCGWTRADL
jgi:hypothetical protein